MTDNAAIKLLSLREKGWLAFALTFGIYGTYIAASYLIGNEHSCEPIANLYYQGSLLTLPVLFAIPLLFAHRARLIWRVFFGVLNTFAGIGMWILAHDTAGMRIVCGFF